MLRLQDIHLVAILDSPVGVSTRNAGKAPADSVLRRKILHPHIFLEIGEEFIGSLHIWQTIPLVLRSHQGKNEGILIAHSPAEIVGCTPLAFLGLHLFEGYPYPFLLGFLQPRFCSRFLMPIPVHVQVLMLVLVLIPVLLHRQPLFQRHPLLLGLPLQLIVDSLTCQGLLQSAPVRTDMILRSVPS